MLPRECEQFIGGNRVAFAQPDIRQDHFAPVGVRMTNHTGFGDGRMPVESLFDFLW